MSKSLEDGEMDDEYISESGQEVVVGESRFRICKVKDSMLMMLGNVEVTDPITGESKTFTTPTPGWDFEHVDEEGKESLRSEDSNASHSRCETERNAEALRCSLVGVRTDQTQEEREVDNVAKTGVVKWFDEAKGYGFITPDEGGSDAFVHFSSINSEGFKTLTEGQKVIFKLVNGDRGLKAEDIDVIG